MPSTGGYLAKGRLLLYLFGTARVFPAEEKKVHSRNADQVFNFA
jgi:hypothetical protein